MDHKFSEIDDVTPLFNLFLVVHLPMHSAQAGHMKNHINSVHKSQLPK